MVRGDVVPGGGGGRGLMTVVKIPVFKLVRGVRFFKTVPVKV